MALTPNTYSTRSLSLIILAALTGFGLWFFAPSFGFDGGSGSGGNNDASAGLPAMFRVEGAVSVETSGDVVTGLVVPISVRGDESIDLNGGKLRAETALAETSLAVVPATFSIEWQGGNGDDLLDPDETALMTVTLPEKSSIHPENPLTLVYTSDGGPTLKIEDVLNR
jgi:hypothetical protein